MQPPVEYPVLLISAADEKTAMEFITELINGANKEASQNSRTTVWQINNKYYSASVQVYSILDTDQTEVKTSSKSNLTLEEAMQRAEAHVVVLSPDEDWSVAEKRISAISDAPGVEVRLCGGADEGLRAGYECVGRGPEDWARLREAVQAHRWPGLQLHHTQGNLETILSALSADEEDIDSNEDVTEEDQWEQLEQFDAIVEQASWLTSRAEQARQAAQDFGEESEQEREMRLKRAEDLLAAFCRITDLTQ